MTYNRKKILDYIMWGHFYKSFKQNHDSTSITQESIIQNIILVYDIA